MDRKILYLIRHGQYTYDETSKGEGSLTELGREQARLTAQRMRTIPISTIHCSTLRRAVETAEIFAAAAPSVPIRRSQGLSECIPCVPSDDSATFANCTADELASGAAQCRKAFGRYFTRPRGNDRRELLVCHGNIIRYFICRALGIPPETWGRLNSHNCGISAVAIYSDGFMMVESYNDVGHLPEHLLTRT